MLLSSTRQSGSIVTAHFTRFDGIGDLRRWRRDAARKLPEIDGVVFAKAMSPLVDDFGFGSGPPDPRRSLLICVWQSELEALEFERHHLAQRLSEVAGDCWSTRMQVFRTRGDHNGLTPLLPVAASAAATPIAVLTLGTTSVARLPRFSFHGMRMKREILGADGLVTALSAGWPPSGNVTFSIWRSVEAMTDFAYGAGHHHLATTRARRPVLTGQLNARMQLSALTGRWSERHTFNAEAMRALASDLGDPVKAESASRSAARR